MKLRTSVEAWALSFSAILGLGGIARGGEADTGADADEGKPSTADSGTSASGGSGSGSTSGVDVSTTATGSGGGNSSGGNGGNGGSGHSATSSGTSASGGTSATGGTTGAGGAGESSTTGSGTTGSPNQTCTNPVAIGGSAKCDEGFYHRPSKAACPSSLPRDRMLGQSGDFGGVCVQDSDCTDAPYGHCEHGAGQSPATVCLYGCVEDSDCSAGEICECGDPVGTCLPASDCEVDSDCPGNAFCASFQGQGACGFERTGYACQSEEDLCLGPGTCTKGDGCVMGSEGRECQPFPWVCGRPYFVAGQARLAGLRARSGWRDDGPRSAGLRDAELARRWSDVALMEHASIAAFARFTLQLLALGAPAELVAASQQASLDEIAHARACFAIASQFAGRELGPGPLPTEGVLDGSQLEWAEVLELVIREGCFGETLAALAATEGAARATDPDIKATLKTIARDEQQHAALAWRTVVWALEQGNDELRRHVMDVFERVANEQLVPSPDESEEQRLAEHGLIVGSLWNQIKRQATRQVIQPLAKQLLAGVARAPLGEASLGGTAPLGAARGSAV